MISKLNAQTNRSLIKSARSSILAITLLMGLSSCVTALVAGAVIATVDIIHDRRTVGEYVDDGAIEVTARNILVSKAEIRRATHVKPVSWNGILLITGEIDDEGIKPELVQRLSNIQGVRQLVDETTITGKTRLLARSNDAWISSKVKSSLLLKTGLDANRVKVITTRKSVYLMGIVTQEEASGASLASSKCLNIKKARCNTTQQC